MDQPVPDSHFRFMALWYRVRDFLAPRIRVLSEVGIQPGFRVLDFGCGPGSYIPPLSRLVGPKGKIYAVDLHPLAIRSVRRIVQKQHLENVEIIETDGATGLPDSSVNAVLLYNTFHDLTEPERILEELARVLKPEGVLSVIDGYISEGAVLSGITRGQRFYLRRKGEKMFIFSKNGVRNRNEIVLGQTISSMARENEKQGEKTQKEEMNMAQQKIVNGVNVDELFKTIDAIKEKPDIAKFKFRATNKWMMGTHNRATIKSFYGALTEDDTRKPMVFELDEPPVLLGKNEGANPVEYLLVALSGCLTTSMVAHAAARGIEIKGVESRYEGDIDLRGFLGISEQVPVGYQGIRVYFKIDANLSEEQKKELIAMAQKYSPVFNTITKSAPVTVGLDK